MTAEPQVDVVAIRERAGVSQAVFARRIGVPLRTLQEWEQGRRKPSAAARALLLRIRNSQIAKTKKK